MTTLAAHVPTFGQYLLKRYGERVHKIALNAAFTCPNRDGSKGIGGCTFCNNVSFNPNGRQPPPLTEQIEAGRQVIRKRTGARKYLAYFQAYTNTYGEIDRLAQQYEAALAEPDVIGLSIGTRPDCVPDEVLDLLAGYQDRGMEIWLELGLQSAFDKTLERVNRGHGFAEYADTVKRARLRNLKLCTHLIAGLPGESGHHCNESLARVLDLGTDGLKLHPLHVVKGTQLANSWRQGEYQPLTLPTYVEIAADLVEATPSSVIWHRLTGTASREILLAPGWCAEKWRVLNAIAQTLQQRDTSHRRVA
ncbi:MAG: TIGR01212 family radical SAM protein [Candidatus Thiodiazotropha sp. (ex Monitilora ramsayi)]|nr:TIGR01212 family radical SAM protein [Candidatus Thiodiazotropha sp. (ex Monitilora ramsayi)]